MGRSRALVAVLSVMCAASIVPAPTSPASTFALALGLPCSHAVHFFHHMMSEVAPPIAVIFCTVIYAVLFYLFGLFIRPS